MDDDEFNLQCLAAVSAQVYHLQRLCIADVTALYKEYYYYFITPTFSALLFKFQAGRFGDKEYTARRTYGKQQCAECRCSGCEMRIRILYSYTRMNLATYFSLCMQVRALAT